MRDIATKAGGNHLAVHVAPWYADAYYNLAQAEAKSQDPHHPWEDTRGVVGVLPTDGQSNPDFVLFQPSPGQEFFFSCITGGVGQLSADGKTIEVHNHYSKDGRIEARWTRKESQ